MRHFCEEREREDCRDWQVRQAEQALWIYFVNFLQRTDWRQAASALVDEKGCTNPFAALDELRRRIRTRHYSYRTECSYADWVRRFFASHLPVVLSVPETAAPFDSWGARPG